MRARGIPAVMTLFLLTALTVVVTAPSARSDDREAQTDAEARRLKGKWTTTEGVRDGKKLTEDELSKIALVFGGPQDGRFYSFTDLRPLIDCDTAKAASFVLEPWEKPKQFYIDRPNGGRVSRYLGVYELDGDTFRICVDLRFSPDGPPDRKRPKEFAATEGSGLTLLTLKRIKGK